MNRLGYPTNIKHIKLSVLDDRNRTQSLVWQKLKNISTPRSYLFVTTVIQINSSHSKTRELFRADNQTSVRGRHRNRIPYLNFRVWHKKTVEILRKPNEMDWEIGINADMLCSHFMVSFIKNISVFIEINSRNLGSCFVSKFHYIQNLNHRQSSEFLQNLRTECRKFIFHCEVRWLRESRMLKRFYVKWRSRRTFQSYCMVIRFAFMVNVTNNLNDLVSIQKQGVRKYISLCRLYLPTKFSIRMALHRNCLH